MVLFKKPGKCERCGTPDGLCGSWTSSEKFMQTERCVYTEQLSNRVTKAEGIIATFLHGDVDQESYKEALDFIKG